jgi:hypothetical protein
MIRRFDSLAIELHMLARFSQLLGGWFGEVSTP